MIHRFHVMNIALLSNLIAKVKLEQVLVIAIHYHMNIQILKTHLIYYSQNKEQSFVTKSVMQSIGIKRSQSSK